MCEGLMSLAQCSYSSQAIMCGALHEQVAWAFCHTSWICNFINLLISCVHLFTESYLSDNDNIALFENITPVNLINLLCIVLI